MATKGRGTTLDRPLRIPYLVSIDLGAKVCGIAVFQSLSSDLQMADEVKSPSGSPLDMAWALWRYLLDNDIRGDLGFVAEKMMDREGKAARSRRLQGLRDVWGELKNLTPGRARFVLRKAEEWKAQVPKRIIGDRVEGLLTEAERSRCVVWTKEVYDAVGIGLVELGRCGRGCV